jgi:hypothetical protein
MHVGIKGVRLEHSFLGAKRFTSAQAIERFIQRTTELRQVESLDETQAVAQTVQVKTRTAAQRKRASERANETCAKLNL